MVSAGHVRTTKIEGICLISTSVFQACCATTGHLGTKKQINKREKSIETGSVTDGNRQRNEGNEKMEAIFFYQRSTSVLY